MTTDNQIIEKTVELINTGTTGSLLGEARSQYSSTQCGLYKVVG
jgi:hypothetical protein